VAPGNRIVDERRVLQRKGLERLKVEV
jgi:hypothetical protein